MSNGPRGCLIALLLIGLILGVALYYQGAFH